MFLCRLSWFTGFTCDLKPKQNQKYSPIQFLFDLSLPRHVVSSVVEPAGPRGPQETRRTVSQLDGHWLVTWCSEDQLRLRSWHRFTIVPSGPPENTTPSQGSWPATFQVQMSSFHPVTMWHYWFSRKLFSRLIYYWNLKKVINIHSTINGMSPCLSIKQSVCRVSHPPWCLAQTWPQITTSTGPETETLKTLSFNNVSVTINSQQELCWTSLLKER